MRRRTFLILAAGWPVRAVAQDDLPAQCRSAMRRAAGYFREKVAARGGYVYHVTLDLRTRWGEGLATPDQVWVQPPATPTAGIAYIQAHEATGDAYYLDAAREAAEALVYGQLESGGWAQVVDFNPRGSKVARYRNGKGRGHNNSTLDDGITQGALRFLCLADRALKSGHAGIHEAVRVGFEGLLSAQYANGAFPQVWTGPVPPVPVRKAAYPEYDWRSEGRVKNYWDMYTLNDQLAGHVLETLRVALAVTGERRFRDAAARLGDFLILAQMPEPQPAWAQQYGYAMHPIWARRFEPPAVTGSESQDVLETLLGIHRITGDAKYLKPIPAALGYLKRSLLPDGRLARYYELKTNRPLYMERRGDQYTLTYSDANLPDHYGWKVTSRLEGIESAYRQATAGATPERTPGRAEVEAEARRVLARLDDEGRWVSRYSGERLVGQPKLTAGERYLATEEFSRNLSSLAACVKLRGLAGNTYFPREVLRVSRFSGFS